MSEWIVKRPQLSAAPPPLPSESLPNAILGTPVLTTAFGTDQNHQFLEVVTIPISWPGGNAGDVDRLVVHLFAPDTAVDTQEAFVGGPGGGAARSGEEVPGIVIGDAANASKIVSNKSSAILIEKPWDPKRPYVQFEQPAPTGDEWWRAVVVSASKLTQNPVDTSPWKRFLASPHPADVSGVEYAPLALDFHLVDQDGATTNLPVYDTAEGGSPRWGFRARWQNDVKDPRYSVLGGYDLVVEYPDGKRGTVTSNSSNVLLFDSEMWTFGADGDFILYCVSWTSQSGNKRNSIIPDLTPHVRFRVARQVGTNGEFADNVLNPLLVNPYWGKNGQGQKALYLPFEWAKPDDRRYMGAKITMLREDGKEYALTGIETLDRVLSELVQFPAKPENVQFRFYSVSTDGKTNPYVAGYPGNPEGTPTLSYNLVPPPETTPNVSVPNVTVVTAKDEFGNNVYGYTGTWANPNRTLFPEYQGIKLVKANLDGTNPQYLSGVETGQSWKSDLWPLVPGGPFYIFLVSVDVNGVEKAITASPVTGPHFITAQGGTISNDALPELDVANFAAGVEPVTFINHAPDANGDVTVAKQTTTVFNNADQRLYRWETTTGKYHVVGSALDIDANTVTAGLVAAGAIRSYHMMSNEILVGPAPSGTLTDQRPPIFKVENISRQMIGFFGTYLGWEGIYALNLKVGPTYASPTLTADALGLKISGSTSNPVTFEITGGSGNYIRMSQITLDPTYSTIATLVSSQTNTQQCYQVSRGLIAYENNIKYLALVRNPSTAAGELTLFPAGDGTNFRVYLSAAFGTGVVRADSYQVFNPAGGTAATPGLTTSGLVACNFIHVVGGIVLAVS